MSGPGLAAAGKQAVPYSNCSRLLMVLLRLPIAVLRLDTPLDSALVPLPLLIDWIELIG
jgi:hypothetical protein